MYDLFLIYISIAMRNVLYDQYYEIEGLKDENYKLAEEIKYKENRITEMIYEHDNFVENDEINILHKQINSIESEYFKLPDDFQKSYDFCDLRDAIFGVEESEKMKTERY